MLIKHIVNQKKAQTLLEYTTIFIIVSAVFMTAQIMIKRGIQGAIKTVADQIGNQEEADQDFKTEFLQNQLVNQNTNSEKEEKEFFGKKTYTYRDQTTMSSTSIMDMGVH